MSHFHYKNDELYCENVPVREIAQTVGTPFYLYCYSALVETYHVFDQSFHDIPHLVCYSMKANSTRAILRTFINLGSGVDIVSGGELFRAMKAGASSERIVFSGVGKTSDEINLAIDAGILMFNVESEQELETINNLAASKGIRARIAIRVNPAIDPKTHPYISTGLEKNKFGINMSQAKDVYHYAKGFKNLNVIGIDCHIGSQITHTGPFIETAHKVKDLLLELKRDGIEIRYIDIGGGLGITYSDETPPHPKEYAAEVKNALKDLDCTLILEPGRVLVGNAGILVSRTLYTKQTPQKYFIIVDAGMNDLLRPSLYDAYQHIEPVQKTDEMVTADIVGPICESGDFLAKERSVPNFKPGDLVAIKGAGAYGFVMASNYNSRPRAAEVMVKEGHFEIIKEREILDDLAKGESVPSFIS